MSRKNFFYGTVWQSLDYVDKQIPKKLNKKTKLSHTRATTVDGGGAGGVRGEEVSPALLRKSKKSALILSKMP